MAFPGIHQGFEWDIYPADERKIIKRFADEWYITSSTRPVQASSMSVYRAFLCRASSTFEQRFNLEREIIALFSSYEIFEARTIDGFEIAAERWDSLRTDPICRILISKDKDIVQKIKDILKNDPELPIIVPFTYDELLAQPGSDIVSNRFRQHFFSRDLFAFESPLKKDTYFFGRSGLINNIISRHKSNESSALFGLRRSGKTSIVFGLERASKLARHTFISIDCQSPSVHQRRWHELLPHVLQQAVKKYNLKKNIVELQKYTPVDAAEVFFEDIKYIYSALNRCPILISFDEIERISPRTGSSPHWAEGTDFILFWQALRSAFQRHTGVFSYLLIGTNPQCIETPFFNGQDNPIFNTVPISYIPGFDMEQTSEMVKKLGRYMGLSFTDAICARLHDDFGGHPYLIRHICSIIHKISPSWRPVTIDKSIYEKAKIEFVSDYATYTEMILSVLVRDFPDEFVMLSALATDDKDLFNTFSNDPVLTNHLRGYGLIEEGANGFYFKIESVRVHLARKKNFRSPVKTNSERLLEIAARRALAEPGLRRLVATIFQSRYGPKAKDEAAIFVKGPALKRLQESGFAAAFSAHSKDTNLSDLARIILGKWELFENMFSMRKSDFDFHIEAIRKARTEESHSGLVTDQEFAQTRISFDAIEKDLRTIGFLNDKT